MKNKSLLKLVSSLLIFAFSFSDLLYAADARQMLMDAKASFEMADDRRGAVSTPAALTTGEAATFATSVRSSEPVAP